MNRNMLIPVTVAAAVSLSGAVLQKAALAAVIVISVPVAGYQFVQAVSAARAQALSQVEHHHVETQAIRMVRPDTPHGVMEDLRASLVVASQIKDRHDAAAARRAAASAASVLQRADLQSRRFKERLSASRGISAEEMYDMERIDQLSHDLRAVRLQLLQAGG